jgi:hypothetical protein
MKVVKSFKNADYITSYDKGPDAMEEELELKYKKKFQNLKVATSKNMEG